VSHAEGREGHARTPAAPRVVSVGLAGEPVYARVDQALTRAAEAVGARYIKSPLAVTSMGTKPATAHPLGGCGIGEDASAGVVNHKCQVFDGEGARVHGGLYVCDGSVVPRSIGVNPLLTISALADGGGFPSRRAPHPRL